MTHRACLMTMIFFLLGVIGAATEIKVVHVINSCHLDIGFADSAAGIINRYFDHHLPAAAAETVLTAVVGAVPLASQQAFMVTAAMGKPLQDPDAEAAVLHALQAHHHTGFLNRDTVAQSPQRVCGKGLGPSARSGRRAGYGKSGHTITKR